MEENMTAKEIRQVSYEVEPCPRFRRSYVGDKECLQFILLEIAAQLAEMNERAEKELSKS